MIKSGDSKEIRLKEFSYALERMESINTFLTTISFAVEDLFNN